MSPPCIKEFRGDILRVARTWEPGAEFGINTGNPSRFVAPRENPVASRAYAGIIKNEIAWAMALGSGNVTESCLSADGIAFYRGIVKITSCTWITEDAAPAYKGGRVWQFQASEVEGWA